jgi:ferric-dicitrate binding protein FerR (iron transport regulator)
MSDRLDELIIRWQDRTLSPEEQEELVRLLGSPKARRRLVEAFTLGYGVLEALREIQAERSEARQQAVAEGRDLPPERWRRVAVTAAALAAGVLLAVALGRLLPGGMTGGGPSPVAVLEQVRGDVRVATASGWAPAEPGRGILAGQDVVTRGARSGAVLRYADATAIELGGETTIRRVQPAPDAAPRGSDRGRSLHLERGTLTARVAPQPAPFGIETPHARLLVRGTRFDLAVDADATRLEVREGRVEMSCEEGTVDVTAGRYAAAGALPAPPRPPASPGVDEAVRRGGEWLLARRDDLSRPFMWKGHPHAYDGLVLLALVHAGVDPRREPRMAALLDGMLARELVSTYDAALQAMALQAVDPARHHRRLEAIARRLESAQCANGQWGYRLDGPHRAAGENSTAHFALLGLRACRDAGISIAPEVARRARAWWRASQNDDGGWGYAEGGNPRRRDDRGPGDVGNASYGSMTAGSVASLLVCGDLLGEGAHHDPAVRRGLDWLGARFDVKRNPGKEGCADLYYLYSLERMADLGGWAAVGGRDWRAEATAHLLLTQQPDGRWDLNTRFSEMGIADTAFAILVLRRSTPPARPPRLVTGEIR